MRFYPRTLSYIIYRYQFSLCEGSAIELLANVEDEYTIEKACTIDTKGFAFNYTVANDFKATVENGVITVVAKVSRKIYVKNDLGYTNTYIYAYNSANTEFPFGAWPGAKLSTKETINGNEFFVYTVPAELDETTFNVIFNDNASSETASKQVTFDADKAYRLSVCGAIDVDPKNTATFGYRVYVWNKNNRSGNDAPTLYIWDLSDGNKTLNGDWPGTKVTNTVTYKHKGGNRTYNYFIMPTTTYGHNIGVIASKEGNNKTGDLKRTLNCDLYVGYWFNSSSSYGFWGNGTAPFTNPFFD